MGRQAIIYLLKFISFISLFYFYGSTNKLDAQVDYLSPLPNSKFNNPSTNIILKVKPDLFEINFDGVFDISSSKSGSCSFEVKKSENQILLLCPLEDFLENDTITVKLIDTIWISNQTVIKPFQWEFYTSIGVNNNGRNLSNEYKKSQEKKSLEENFPSMTISVNNNPAKGKIFFYNVSDLASNNDRFLAIIDNNANPEYKRQENEKGLGFTLQPSGYISFWNGDGFALMDSSYRVFDTIACGNGYETDFHEFINLPSGHSLLLSWDAQTVDMSKIVSNGLVDAVVQGLIIQELDKSENVIFQWRSWDHFEITDAEDIDFTTPYISYVHGNGLAVCADGNILLSSRVMNEITKINRTTGEIIWRFGGKKNQFSFINDPDKFCRQHHIKEIHNGNLTLFDNGSCHTPQISKAKEYRINEIDHTAELIWEYSHPQKIYCSTMGSVQRLDNGNTFINWGMITNSDNPNITEVRQDKSIAYELYFNTYFHLLYRSFRFEWNNNISTKLDKTTLNGDHTAKIYPNPVLNFLIIHTTGTLHPNTTISIFDINGKLIIKKKAVHYDLIDNQTVKINIHELKTGFYMVWLKNNNQSITQKVFVTNKNY